MVLTWAPQRLNSTSSWCSGVDAFLLARPTASPQFIALNYGLFYSYVIFGSLCLAAWYYFRRSLVLINRSLTLISLNYLATCIVFCVICLRHALVDDNNRAKMFCQVVFWLYISIIPLASSCTLLRQISLINRGRYARLANQLPHYLVVNTQQPPGSGGAAAAGIIELAAVGGSSASIASSSDMEDDQPPQHILQWCSRTHLKMMAINTLQAIKFGIGFSEGGLSPHEDVSSGSAAAAAAAGAAADQSRRGSYNEYEKRLMTRLSLALNATKFKAVCVLLIIFYSPVVIVVALTLPLSDPYKTPDCRGCDMYIETVIIIIVEFVLFRAVKSVLFRKIKTEEIADPDAIIPELRISQTFSGLGGLIAIILLGVDPGNLDYNQTVSWEWFFCIGFFLAFCVQCPLQVVKAYRVSVATAGKIHEERPSNAGIIGSLRSIDGGGNSSIGGLDLLEALRNDQLMNRFETFCIKFLVVETVRFMREARGFHEYADDRSHDWMKKKAWAIYNTYIKQGSTLQVNVSSATRVKIETILKSKGTSGSEVINKRLFDEAVKECAQTLRYHIWPKFVEQIEAENALASSNKHMTMKAVLNRVSGWASSSSHRESSRTTALHVPVTAEEVSNEVMLLPDEKKM